MLIEPDTTAPGFFIVGAAKAGTTALWTWLRRQPEVFLPEVKEPGFFAFAASSAKPKKGLYDPDYFGRITTEASDYASLYANTGTRLAGDVSPVYLINERAASRIASVRPDARIVILLRDPVGRAFSQYLHHVRDGLEPCESFEAALAAEPERMKEGWSWGHGYATNSHYAAQVERYLDAFPRNQILFLDYDDLQKEPTLCWQKLCDHLEISRLPITANERVNATSTLVDVPAIPAITRQLRHPGPVQTFLKKWLPSSSRSALRRRLESASRAVPELSLATRRSLAHRYLGERPQLEAWTGLSLSHWST